MNNEDKPIMFGILTFKDFICESFSPKKVDFGYDLKNKEWAILGRDFIGTFFKSSENQIYAILFRNNHFGFALYVKDEPFNPDKLNNINDVIKQFTFKSRATGNALRVFNEVIYIILDFIKQFNSEIIYFSGADADLKRLYALMVKDKSFLKILDGMGYFYDGYKETSDQIELSHIIKKK